MITERTIVRMLLNSHHLNAIITILDDTRQHILTELIVCAHLLRILSHAYMALVDKQRTFLWFEVLLFEIIFLSGVPYLSRKDVRLFVLHNATTPSRNTLTLATVPLYLHLVKLTMLQVAFAQLQFPVTSTLNTLTFKLLILLPIIKITNQINLRSIRGPLTEHPSTQQFM